MKREDVTAEELAQIEERRRVSRISARIDEINLEISRLEREKSDLDYERITGERR